jgi:polar amino acid transport system substrate-binding protein
MLACRRFALCCALLFPLIAPAGELVILVDTATEMPMARAENFQLVDGMHRDVGLALAKAMGREPRFLLLPRMRIVGALEAGDADILCGYVPGWIKGGFAWSQPFLPQVEVVITNRSAARPHTIADLAGKPIGTVFGFAYPDMERALGKGFVRADGPSSDLNLRKLALGRIQHMVTVKDFIDYRLKLGDPPLSLHPQLAVTTHMTRCAVSPKGRVSVAEVDRAVAQIVREGAVAAIGARYK